MKKYCFQTLLMLMSIIPSVHAESNDQQKIQDTSAAAKYFEDKLNFTAGPGSVKKVSEKQLDGIIIDLRKKEHFDKGHIPGAINMPFDKYDGFEGAQTEFPGLSKNKINYLYCYELLCNLSQKAAKKFASLGYPVKEVEGGFKGWEEHNYPIEK
ncbi:MAG: rhodanese-like domain-containing protein [Alphaproteobacteria bacterium]|nr:rhodanese-like domain-containing protein [Alphaproteobacteria bacterium]